MAKILLVEDDSDLAENVQDWLRHEKYVVEHANSAEMAAELLLVFHYDLLILDWKLPGITGVDLVGQYRAGGGQTFVLMITGNRDLKDKETGLDAGADDYLTKPFNFKELSARVRALLRRPKNTLATVLKVGNISLDCATREVKNNNQVVQLMPKELAILELFLKHPNQVFDADAIIDRVWHSEKEVGPETVRTNILRLRKLLDVEGEDSVIKNIRGQGYKLVGPDT